MPEHNRDDRAADRGETPDGGHGRTPTENSGGDSVTSKPNPFGTVPMAQFFHHEGIEGRMPLMDALIFAEAELELYQKITAARDAQVTAPVEGLVSRNPASTSAKAARRVEPKSGTQRAAVLREIVERGGCTDYELSFRLRLLASSVRPRRLELQQHGYVINSGRTREHRGTTWIIWAPTAEAIAWHARQGFAAPEAGAA